MLKALYDYAQKHPEVRQAIGCELKNISFVVDLTADGQLVGVRAQDKEHRNVLCPTAGTMSNRIDAHPIADKASTSLRLTPEGLDEKKLGKLKVKQEIFLQRFQDGVTEIPEFYAVYTALSTPETMAKIQEEYAACGGKEGDCVSFSVSGRDLWSMPEVLAWWSRQCNTDPPGDPKDMVLDVVTGKPCVPAPLWKQMRGRAAMGGQSTGVALVSFNAPAFESYQKEQGANCPVSKETADAIMDAAIYLSANAATIGTVRLLHWYSERVAPEDDFFEQLLGLSGEAGPEDENEEAAMDSNVNKMVNAPFKGEMPPNMEGVTYHMIYMQPKAARMVVRRYEQGSYATMYRSIQAWYKDLNVVTASGIVANKTPSLYALMFGLLSDTETSAKTDKIKPLEAWVPYILDSCFYGRPLPDPLAARALSGFRSGIYATSDKDAQNLSQQHKRIQWLKLWLNRIGQNDERRNAPMIDETANKNLKYPAYVCGRLMAIYDKIQRVAYHLNTSVVAKWYTACSQSPAQVLCQIQKMSVHHLEAIESNYVRNLLEKELGECWSLLTDGIPDVMSMQDQSYFACGYWQELADLNKTIFDKKANDKEDQ